MIDVTCAIIEHNDRILITQRSEKMHPQLKWEFPGGKIDDGESAEECLVREIKEELNIEIQILGRMQNNICNYGIKKINLIPFRAGYIKGEIILHEHKNFKWISPKDIFKYDLAEADIPIARDYLRTMGI